MQTYIYPPSALTDSDSWTCQCSLTSLCCNRSRRCNHILNSLDQHSVHCHHDTVRPGVADGGDGLHVRRVAVKSLQNRHEQLQGLVLKLKS
jgi:hypothetical protein